MALTASADIKSRSRVIRLLHMDNAVQIIASPNKTNISLGLCKVPTHHMNCLDWIVQHAKDKGSTMLPILIYCQSLKSVGRVFSYLKAELQGHAWVGCDPDCRSENLLIGMFHSKTLPQNKQRVLASLRGEGNCIFDLAYISTNLPVFRLDHAKEILIIISDVFGDIDGDLQYDSERYLTDPDLYFSHYFDDNVDDDDVDEALTSHVSSSESEQ